MRSTKLIVVVFLCLGACLVGLVVAHLQLRQETARLSRSVHLAILARTHTPDVPYEVRQDLERLDSELTEVKNHVDELDSKVRHNGLEDLKDEVGRLRGSVLDARALISEIPDSSDIVKRFELDRETMALEKRIENIEDKLRIIRY